MKTKVKKSPAARARANARRRQRAADRRHVPADILAAAKRLDEARLLVAEVKLALLFKCRALALALLRARGEPVTRETLPAAVREVFAAARQQAEESGLAAALTDCDELVLEDSSGATAEWVFW